MFCFVLFCTSDSDGHTKLYLATFLLLEFEAMSPEMSSNVCPKTLLTVDMPPNLVRCLQSPRPDQPF